MIYELVKFLGSFVKLMQIKPANKKFSEIASTGKNVSEGLSD